MTIYLDSDFKCSTTSPSGAGLAVKTDIFAGKCKEYIEGYRFVPAGQTWTREDGEVFTGEMVSPWQPWEQLDAIQREYEREQYSTLRSQNAEYEAALTAIEAALEVTV